MTVKELKRKLDFVPDDARVLIIGYEEDGAVTSTDACVIQAGIGYIELGRTTDYEKSDDI